MITPEQALAILDKRIVELIWDQDRPRRWIGLRLDDGTAIYADGGEDAHGGYGFLDIDGNEE